MMHRLQTIKPLPDYRLSLRFEDGTEGEVDVSDLVGKGVFAAWAEPDAFVRVSIGTGGEPVWECGVDLCPDTLYMQVTGKTPEQLFASLTRVDSHA